jgi:hypothetical protein
MRIKRYIKETAAKASGGGVEGFSSEYIREAELHGRHIYWHGSANLKGEKVPHQIDTENAQKYGTHPCFFFTTHFGYAIAYVYPDKADVGISDDSLKRSIVYKPYGKFFNELPMDSKLIAGTDSWEGWIYPLSLPQGVNIFLAGTLNDKRKLQSIIANSEYKPFYPNEQKFLELFGRLAKEDWFFLDNEKSKYGFNREELLKLMEKQSAYKGTDGENYGEYSGFYGFHNFETDNKLSSLGMFKSRMKILQVGKPFKVSYVNGKILISENY